MWTKVHVYWGESQLIIGEGNFNLPLINHTGPRQHLGSKHAKLHWIGGSFFCCQVQPPPTICAACLFLCSEMLRNKRRRNRGRCCCYKIQTVPQKWCKLVDARRILPRIQHLPSFVQSNEVHFVHESRGRTCQTIQNSNITYSCHSNFLSWFPHLASYVARCMRCDGLTISADLQAIGV